MRNTLIYVLFILLMGCVKSSPAPIPPITPTPVITIPNAPTDLKGVLSAPTQIDLTWTDASNNEDGFKIERKSGTEAFTLLTSVGQNIASYSDKGLNAGINYTYRVYSYNTKGNSTNSNEIAVKTEDAEVGLLRVGLVAYYPFTGNAGDSSGNGNNGIVNGATLTTDRYGNANKAYDFNGASISEIAVNNNFINLASDFSITVWMKTIDITKKNQCLFNSINHTGFVVELNNDNVPNKLMYGVGNSVNFWDLIYGQGAYSNFQNNIWHNIAFIKSGSTYSIYVNGVLDGSSKVNQSSLYNLKVGLRIGAIGPGYEVFKGVLDEVRVYNRVLLQSEITYLYKH